ncbi:MAG: VTT domain-containing protein [Myxococcales bacterium]|nr:VTT domain-containing protein [Myxococcales bacterium]
MPETGPDDPRAVDAGDALADERVAPRPGRARTLVRLLALALVLVGLYVLAKRLGLVEYIYSGALQDDMQGAGALGLAVFALIYCVGVVAHIPGLVFVVAAVFAYGALKGGVIGLLVGIPAVSLTFLIVRAIGGRPLERVSHPLARRFLDHLDERPILSVVLLRIFFVMMPGVNYGLALSSVRFRDYVIGSAIGLVIPVSVAALVIEGVVFSSAWQPW